MNEITHWRTNRRNGRIRRMEGTEEQNNKKKRTNAVTEEWKDRRNRRTEYLTVECGKRGEVGCGKTEGESAEGTLRWRVRFKAGMTWVVRK
jgi:hypothetical protein